jgi:hypothetical protein
MRRVAQIFGFIVCVHGFGLTLAGDFEDFYIQPNAIAGQHMAFRADWCAGLARTARDFWATRSGAPFSSK